MLKPPTKTVGDLEAFGTAVVVKKNPENKKGLYAFAVLSD